MSGELHFTKKTFDCSNKADPGIGKECESCETCWGSQCGDFRSDQSDLRKQLQEAVKRKMANLEKTE